MLHSCINCIHLFLFFASLHRSLCSLTLLVQKATCTLQCTVHSAHLYQSFIPQPTVLHKPESIADRYCTVCKCTPQLFSSQCRLLLSCCCCCTSATTCKPAAAAAAQLCKIETRLCASGPLDDGIALCQTFFGQTATSALQCKCWRSRLSRRLKSGKLWMNVRHEKFHRVKKKLLAAD